MAIHKEEEVSPQRPKLMVISHTHWDREWYQPFQVFRLRLVELIDDLLEILRSEPEYRHFTLDGQTVVLEDYLEIRPERRRELEELIGSGRLVVGPWYVLPDEFIVGGESLVRNLLVGRRVARAFGGSMDVGYLPDQFGHVGQMPQILRGFGIDTAVLWRGVSPDLAGRDFRWRAPDGSEVLAVHLVEGYFNAVRLPAAEAALRPRLAELMAQLAQRAGSGVLPLMNGSDHVFPQRDLLQVLATARELLPEADVVQGTLPELAREVRRAERLGDLPLHAGELRHCRLAPVLPGVLSARVWLKQRNAACERLLTQWAEPATALASLAGVDGGRLPSRRAALARAWQYLLQNHAHDSICGCSVDDVHDEMRARFKWVEQMAATVAEKSRRDLAGAVDTLSGAGREACQAALVVFNSQSGPRTDCLLLRARLRPGERLRAWRDEGVAVPVQVLSTRPAEAAARDMHGGIIGSVLDLAPEGEAEEQELALLASDVPERGYCVLHVAAQPSPQPPPSETEGEMSPAAVENEHFRLTARSDGAFDLLDKASGEVWERLGLLVDGGDAGDEYNYCPPPLDRAVVGPAQPVVARVAEAGPVRFSVESRGSLRLPAALAPDRSARADAEVECPFVLRASLYPGVRRVDFALEVANNAADHRLRAHFPLRGEACASLAEGHFELVERATSVPPAGEDWVEQPLGTHPHQGLVLAGGLAVVAPGLPEYEIVRAEGRSAVALTLLRAVGWLSRDDLATRRGHAGPGIPTPGAQAIGRHAFAFAVFLHEGEPARALSEAHRFANPLVAEAAAVHEGPLPPRMRFLQVSPPQVVLTALKPAEEGEGIVVRLYNPSAEPLEAVVEFWRADLAAALVDLEERPRRPLPCEGGRVVVPLGPRQIGTVKFGQRRPRVER